MRIPRIALQAGALCLTAALAACSSGHDGGTPNNPSVPSDPGRDDTSAGVVEVLNAAATGVVEGDGPSTCSVMTADAQRAFEQALNAETCIDALSKATGGLTEANRNSLGHTRDWSVEVSQSTARVTGASSEVLASILGLRQIQLIRDEGRWSIS